MRRAEKTTATRTNDTSKIRKTVLSRKTKVHESFRRLSAWSSLQLFHHRVTYSSTFTTSTVNMNLFDSTTCALVAASSRTFSIASSFIPLIISSFASLAAFEPSRSHGCASVPTARIASPRFAASKVFSLASSAACYAAISASIHAKSYFTIGLFFAMGNASLTCKKRR